MVRLGAISDIHARPEIEPALIELFTMAEHEVDLLVIAGDLTDTGLEDEARLLGRIIEQVDLPVAAVLGNHDFHNNQQVAIRQVLESCGVHILDGEGWTFQGDGLSIGIGGVVGFGGGFRPYGAAPFGEPEWKYLYTKIVEESRKLDRALSAVRHADVLVAVMHYSPTVDTMGDEPEALHAYLGSSELGDAIERHNVLFALHGHAHRGRRDGCTAAGIPVFNVSRPIVEWPLVWTFGTSVDPETVQPRELAPVAAISETDPASLAQGERHWEVWDNGPHAGSRPARPGAPGVA